MAGNIRINRQDHSGATAPVTLIMLAIIGILGIVTLLFVRGSTVAAHRQYYTRLASSGATSAVNYAQEMFNQNPEYAGSSELAIISNSDYRVTISAEVVATSKDGLAKTVRGIGTVYVTDVSETHAYTYDVVTKTLYTYATDKTPDTYGPIAWYDAAATETLRGLGEPTTTVVARTTFGQPDAATRDTVEEPGYTHDKTPESWQSPDLDLDACDPVEFPLRDCTAGDTKLITSGVVFRGVSVPAGSNILAANLSLPVTYVSEGNKSAYRICGYYNATGGPIGPFSSTGQQIGTPTDGSRDIAGECAVLKTAASPASGLYSVDVAKTVTQMVRHPLWGSANPEGTIGFIISHDDGDGHVSVAKDGIVLNVTYGSSRLSITKGETVGEWWDRSPFGNHARLAPGQAPGPFYSSFTGYKKLGVTFDSNTLSAKLNPTGNSREQTVITLVSPYARPADSISETAVISAQSNNATSSTNFLSSLSTDFGYSARPWPLANPLDETRATFTCSQKVECPTLKPMLLSVVNSDNGSSVTTSLRANGKEQASVSAPIRDTNSFQYDQLTISGNPATSAQPATFSNGTYYEIIVYDRRLACHEVSAIENYLREKWELSDETWDGGCPAQQIPLL